MTSRSLKGLWAPALALTLTAAACGGGGGAKEEAPAAPAQPATVIDPATAAGVSGLIKFDGAVPPVQRIRMAADPVCARENADPKSDTVVIAADGAIANVLVYVKDGLTGNFPAPATPVLLNQKGCQYIPHVFGVQVGQPVQVVNSDPTLHNVHVMPKTNQEFNTGQPIQGMKFDHTFTAREVMVPFKCDVHGWMQAHAAVLDHPFFAVTGADGKFELKGLPPGNYTLEAVHEKLGTQTLTVELAAKDAKTADFSFKAPS
jgi:plastocyanin